MLLARAHFAISDKGKKAVQTVGANGAEVVTWVHSDVPAGKRERFCDYDRPGPEAIRTVAIRNRLPSDATVEVQVLDRYFYS